MPKLNSFIVPTAAYGLIGVMWHTNTAFDKINQDLERLATRTYSELSDLKDCMIEVQDWCTHCEQVLKDMKEALIYAKETQSFAQMYAAEMREVCQDLHNTFQLLDEANGRISIQKDAFKDISDAEKRFEYNYIQYKYKYWAVGSVVGATLTMSATDNILLGFLGTVFGFGMTRLGMYCTSYTKSHTKRILKRVSFDTKRIKDTAYNSVDKMSTIVNHLEVQFDHAEKNERRKEITGIRVEKQVDMMIDTIYSLQEELEGMRLQSQANQHDVDRIMKLENVVDLL